MAREALKVWMSPKDWADFGLKKLATASKADLKEMLGMAVDDIATLAKAAAPTQPREAVVERYRVVDSAGYPLCSIGGMVEFAETLTFGDDWFIEYSDEEEAEADAEKFGGNVESFQCIRRIAA